MSRLRASHRSRTAARVAPAGLGIALLVAAPATAQITGSNLLQARVGVDPYDPRLDVPDNRYTLFDQFHLDYDHASLQLGFRFEHYDASEDGSLGYSEFVQRYAVWRDRGLSVRVGNFHALLGRGLLLRAFELPGVVREEQFRQYGYLRDMDGASVEFRHGTFEAVVLSGKPRRADEPPETERSGLASGAQASMRVVPGLELGAEYLRFDAQNGGPTTEVPGGFAQIAFEPWLAKMGLESVTLGAYVEYAEATGLDPATSIATGVDPDEGRGTYVATDLSIPLIAPHLHAGASWEYKDYRNLLLPGGINEPPTLVREHSYALLNRSTHVLEPAQEEGTQFETRFDWRRSVDLTLNWSRAENADTRRFREFFAELAAHRGALGLSLFYDESEDGSTIPPVFDRRTLGTHALLPFHPEHSVELEAERMEGTRDLSTGDIDFTDEYASLTYAWASHLSLTAAYTRTDDPGDPGAGEPDPTTGVYPRHDFASLGLSVRVSSQHEVLAFWGQRRGGIACTAGTCYLVPAFDGVSVQLSSRF
jgi:hypothetical protein